MKGEDVKTSTVASEWRHFREMVLDGEDYTVDQVEQLRMAFYGGVHVAVMLFAAIGERGCTEDEGVEALDRWRREGEAYVAALATRYGLEGKDS